jgi:multiple sugar transport system substrate-binding protein
MPDLMGSLSLGDVRQIATQKLINTDAAAAVIKELDPKTFAPSALSLTKDGDAQLEVPSDAWAQILVYRKDLFAKAGLKPPTTYDALLAAAKKLTTDGQFGITLATDPADTFTGQSFEAVALGNDCQLVDGKGTITLDSPQCAKAFDLYGQLAQNYSPKGTQTVDTTRASYFAGKSAMVMWSTYILDELAGLRNDALPTCPECKGDKTWLAKNSGIVTNIQGPDSKSGGDYGEIAGWTISSSAKANAAEKFVEFVMSTDYTKWLGMAPEGEFPVRKGPKAGSTEYVDAWSDLKAGVDTKAPLSSIYDAATMKEITGVASSIDRWALPEGQGDLIGPLTAQNTIPKVIAALGSGSIDAQQAQQQAQAAVEKVKGSLK